MMRLIFISVLIFVSASVSAKPSDCLKINNDLDRLACYDKEVGRTPKIENISKSDGEWAVTKETSKITDQTNVYMMVESKEVVNCGWNRGDKIRLMVRCRENVTALIFNTGCHMTASSYSDYGNVTYRLDSDKARTIRGNESTDNRALGFWSGGRSVPIIKQMFGKSRMIVRMTPFSESPFTATFNIAGLESAIVPLRKACNW